MFTRTIVLPVLLACSGSVYAAAYTCTGKVTDVSTGPDGSVNASFEFGNGRMLRQAVCNLNHSEPVSVPACKAVLNTLTVAKVSDRPVMMWFDNADQECNAPAWGVLRSRGWYWGPSLQ